MKEAFKASYSKTNYSYEKMQKNWPKPNIESKLIIS